LASPHFTNASQTPTHSTRNSSKAIPADQRVGHLQQPSRLIA
jgi:hypothetical protein